VVEILETPVDAEVITACQRLEEAGYLIALDDYVVVIRANRWPKWPTSPRSI
jgi:c-di-GMP-related signal transduction protein